VGVSSAFLWHHRSAKGRIDALLAKSPRWEGSDWDGSDWMALAEFGLAERALAESLQRLLKSAFQFAPGALC
jgi:hypothetical protein